MDSLLQDLKYALRMLRKSPGFTTVAVLTLALGIGANTAIFTVVNAALLRPLPYTEPDRLVKVWTKFDSHGLPRNWTSEPEYWEMRERTASFSGLAAYVTGRGLNLTAEGSEPLRVSAGLASADLFPVLGVSAARGRVFTAEEDQPGRSQVVVLSDGLWRRQFGADPAVLGSQITLNAQNYTVIGILPAGFNFGGDAEMWAPIALDKAKPANRGSHYLQVIGRIKPGLTPAQASAELQSLGQQLVAEAKYQPDSGFGIYTVPLREELVGGIRPALLMLLGAVAFVLLIACANIANLLLARASTRQKEVALRAALGAGRMRIMRQLLTESVLMALVGAVLGLLLGYWGVEALVASTGANLPELGNVALDARVLLFTLAIGVFAGLLFGIAPALQVARPDLHDSLKEGGRHSGSAGHHRLRSSLVISEIALALVLLIGAGLMIKSFSQILAVDPGFQADRLLTLQIALPAQRYSAEAVPGFYRELAQRIGALPGVRSVGMVSNLPMTGSSSSGTTVLDDASVTGSGRTQRLNLPFIEADRRSVAGDYFKAMGIELISGRVFNESDTESSPLVAIVDESFANRFWPGQNVLGKRIAIDTVPGSDPMQPRWREIVGVVRHVKHYGLAVDGREQTYLPVTQRPTNAMAVTVRTSSDPVSMVNAVRAQVRALDPLQPIFQVQTMEEVVDASLAQRRLNLYLLVIFSGLSLLLAGVGIYGVMSYAVSQRSREIGIRMALGAQPGDVLRLVLGHSARMAVAGVLVGIGGALALSRVITHLLFGVQATDPATFLAIPVLLLSVALLASAIPAWRATRVQPIVALRYE